MSFAKSEHSTATHLLYLFIYLLNDRKEKRVGLGGTLACGPIQAHVSQRDTAGFRPVQPGSMRSATVPAMLSPAGTHQGHFSRDLIGICFGLLRRAMLISGVVLAAVSFLPSFLPSFPPPPPDGCTVVYRSWCSQHSCVHRSIE